MYNPDITSIVKYKVIPNRSLKDVEITFLDFVYSGDNDKSNSYSTIGSMTAPNILTASIGPKVFIKKLSDEIIKTMLLSDTNIIFEEIMNTYYDMYLENIKDNTILKFEYNINDDTRRLMAKVNFASNAIASESRIGAANVIVLPDNKYENLFKWWPTYKIIINPLEIHKDKIFVIRVDPNMDSPGLFMFTNKDIAAERYFKLLKLMNKMGKKIDDLSFNYILTKVGFSSEKFVQCIYLTKN